jgi:hypothetical protein
LNQQTANLSSSASYCAAVFETLRCFSTIRFYGYATLQWPVFFNISLLPKIFSETEKMNVLDKSKKAPGSKATGGY